MAAASTGTCSQCHDRRARPARRRARLPRPDRRARRFQALLALRYSTRQTAQRHVEAYRRRGVRRSAR